MKKENYGSSGSANYHAKWSASGADQWVPCTKSIGFIDKLRANGVIPQEGRTSAAASEGTLAHNYADYLLRKKLGQDPPFIKLHEDLVPDLKKLNGYVQRCLDSKHENDIAIVEHVVPLFYNPTETGTSDWVCIHRQDEKDKKRVTGLTVRDLKYGQGVYTLKLRSYENRQLAIYTLSTIMDLIFDGDLEDNNDLPITMELDKPRVETDAGSWNITLGDLKAFCYDIQQASNDIRDQTNLKWGPSIDTCVFCEAKNHCQARLYKAAQVIPSNLKEVPTDINTIVDIYLAVPLIKAMIKTVEERMWEHVDKHGTPPDRVKLVEGSLRRSYKSEQEAIQWFIEQGLDVDDYMKPAEGRKLISMGIMEKAFKGADKVAFQKILDKKRLAPKLVADSDPRETVFSEMEELFSLD